MLSVREYNALFFILPKMNQQFVINEPFPDWIYMDYNIYNF